MERFQILSYVRLDVDFTYLLVKVILENHLGFVLCLGHSEGIMMHLIKEQYQQVMRTAPLQSTVGHSDRPFRATGLSDGLPTKLSAETLNQVTGGDQTRMRGMRVASAVMEVSAVPLLVCNDTSAPALFVDDQGIKDRLHVIPFIAPSEVDDSYFDVIRDSENFADTYFSVLMDRCHERWKSYEAGTIDRTMPS